MNIAFDPREWSVASADAAAAQDGAHPDWAALRSRLDAGLDAWNALASDRSGARPARFGSFSRRASLSLERVTGQCDLVNQTSSVNRKRGGRNIPDVADMSASGERG